MQIHMNRSFLAYIIKVKKKIYNQQNKAEQKKQQQKNENKRKHEKKETRARTNHYFIYN